MPARVWIINGNPMDATARIAALGGRPYGEGYSSALRFFEPELEFTILDAADGGTLPAGVALSDFDGAAWTGSALSAYEDKPEVGRQIALARAVHAARLPCFGSCWGQQIMCQALGGEVRANPNGIEIGVARAIVRTGAGRSHPMFSGKMERFDALTVHRDEVVTLPPGARILASNAMSAIQAMDLRGTAGDFWGVQYHPEFDLHLMGVLFRRDRQALLEQGLYKDSDAIAGTIADFTALNDNPANAALAAKHHIGPGILDPAIRMAELGNWLKVKVLPRAAV